MRVVDSIDGRRARAAGSSVFATALLSTLLVLAPALAGLWGAAAGSALAADRATGADMPLEHWLAEVLMPDLAGKLGGHPRFRGHPVQVLAMRGDSPVAVPDGLSHGLVQRLSDLVADTPGSRLIRGRRARSDAQCLEQAAVEYRIAVEAVDRGHGRGEVQVRVFDLHEGSWVGGIGGRWTGRLTSAEQRRLAQTRPLEYARGDRALPFSGNQTDLLAAAIASELRCALLTADTGGALAGTPHIHLAAAPALPPALQRAGLLVVHSLALEHGMARVDDPATADLVLRPHAHVVDAPLTFYWLTLERGVSSVPGRADGAAPVSGSGPVIASAGAYVADEYFAAASGPGPVAENRVPATAQRLQQALLSVPRLVDTRGRDDCLVRPGGRRGGDGRGADDCAVVEFEVARDADLHLLWQPSVCQLAREARLGEPWPREQRRSVQGPVTVRVPMPRDTAQAHGYASLYVVAVEAHAEDRALRAVLESHPGGRNCDSPRWADDLERWAHALEAALAALGERADWQALRVSRTTLAEAAR